MISSTVSPISSEILSSRALPTEVALHFSLDLIAIPTPGISEETIRSPLSTLPVTLTYTRPQRPIGTNFLLLS